MQETFFHRINTNHFFVSQCHWLILLNYSKPKFFHLFSRSQFCFAIHFKNSAHSVEKLPNVTLFYNLHLIDTQSSGEPSPATRLPIYSSISIYNFLYLGESVWSPCDGISCALILLHKRAGNREPKREILHYLFHNFQIYFRKYFHTSPSVERVYFSPNGFVLIGRDQ